jgi:putative transposase
MPKNLKRIAGRGHLHFITFCCYQRRPLLAMLATVRSRNLAVRILGEVRARFGFLLVGYVIMPEHLHLLISESDSVSPAKVVQVFKQRVSRRMRGKKRSPGKQLPLRFPEEDTELRRFWQRRYHDFNVYSRAKLQEKLHYMHANPVRAKLVQQPRDWPWSSWCYYYRGAGCCRWMRGYHGRNKNRTVKDCKKQERPNLCQPRKG